MKNIFKTLFFGFIGILLSTQAYAGFGLRGDVGYGLGSNNVTVGGRAAGGDYSIPTANGLAGGLEVLYAPNTKVEFGLGVFAPLGMNADKSSTYNDPNPAYSYSDATTLKSSNVPIVLSVYLKQSLANKLSLVSGAGIGLVLPGDAKYNNVTSDKYNDVSNTAVTESFNAGIAFRGVLGLEYGLSPNLSLFGGLNFIAASLRPKTKTEVDSDNFGGTPYTTITTYQSGDGPDDTAAPPTQNNVVGGNGTIVNYNSQTDYTTRYYVNGNLTKTVRTMTDVKQSNPLDQLSFVAGLTYRFGSSSPADDHHEKSSAKKKKWASD